MPVFGPRMGGVAIAQLSEDVIRKIAAMLCHCLRAMDLRVGFGKYFNAN